MAVVIGFIPDEYGEAALTAGLEEAQRRQTGVVVVNSTRGDALVDKRYVGAEGMVTLEQRLVESGVEHELRQTMGRDIAEEILAVAVRGQRRRHRDRHPAPHPGGQADHGQRRPARHHRRRLPGGGRQAR